MSSWNYRVIKKATVFHGEPYFEIHEVYYAEDNNEIAYWSSDPMTPFGETAEELATDLKHMAEAFNKPILELVNDLLKEVEE